MADKKKSDLVPRVVTAVVAVPVLLYLVFAAPKWMFSALVVVAAAISVWEYCNITYGKEHKPGTWVTAGLGAVFVGLILWAPNWSQSATESTRDMTIPSLALCSLVIFLYFLFDYRKQDRATHYIGSSITGLVYGSVLFATMGLLHLEAGNAGALWILLTLCIVWVSDTGAYFTGRAFGKTKLYKAVSPNKSVEGAVGGFVLSIAAAVGLNAWYPSWVGDHEILGSTFVLTWNQMELWQILLVAIPANLLGQTGDLVESLVKRAHDVKDSGTIIYGHGGMLDRIDALIFAGPWVYICSTYFR